MLLTAAALLISVMVTIYLLGCGGKDRSRTQAGAQSETPTVSKQLEAKPPRSAEHTPDVNAGPSVNRSVKSKVEDDGGYESCPDMTPSQLAKAAKLGD